MKLEIDAGCSLTVLNGDTLKELRRKWGEKFKTKTDWNKTGNLYRTTDQSERHLSGCCGVPRVKENTPYCCSDWQWFKLAGFAEFKLSWDQIKHNRQYCRFKQLFVCLFVFCGGY